MGSWEWAEWEPSADTALTRNDRRSGRYRRYLPSPLEDLAITFDAELSRALADAEAAARALSGRDADSLASIARFLLRSEAIASSQIEGLAPSPQQVALAELGAQESVRGVSDQAQLVANNMTVVRQATTDLVSAPEVSLEHIIALQAALLPGEPRHHGLRQVQNWIGGSNRHPLDADFVPPPFEQVPQLMADLVSYLDGAAHAPIVQAALVHAQFETIHPFVDGNGRVGRALIHTVLTRRGLTPTAVLPVSLVLATLRETYVTGLTRFRYEGSHSDPRVLGGVRDWIVTFASACRLAAEQASDLAQRIGLLEEEWTDRLTSHRGSQGVRPRPRADSATARLLHSLPEAPVVTARTLQRILGVSFNAAAAALDELRNAGVLQTRAIERGTTAYIATEVLDLITVAERRLASTAFDTRSSTPNRPVAALPDRSPHDD